MPLAPGAPIPAVTVLVESDTEIEGVDVPAQASQQAREEFDRAERAAAQTGGEKRPGGRPIVWTQRSPEDRISADGRFVISVTGPWHNVWDLWTGESVAKLMTASAAEQWCRVRTNAPPLLWKDYGSVTAARTDDGIGFGVVHVARGVLCYGADARLAGTPLEVSPMFRDIENAQRWCEVRACCRIEPTAPGGKPTLRFQDPVPF